MKSGTCILSLVPRLLCVGGQEPGNEANAYSDRKVAHAYSDRVREGRRTMSIHLPQCGAASVHADLCFLAAI